LKSHPPLLVPTRMKRASVTALLPLLMAVAAGCDAGDSPASVSGLELSEIRIAPLEAVVSVGQEAAFTATLIDVHGLEIEPGPGIPEVLWTTEDMGVASPGAPGRILGTGAGFTTVTASVAGLRAQGIAIVQPASQGIGFEGGELEFEGVAGLPLEDGIGVRVRNPAGSPMQGVTVRFTSRPGSGSVDPQLAVTDASGIARTEWTLGRRAGLQRVDASAPLPASAGLAAVAVESDEAAAPPGGNPQNPKQKLVGWARPGKPHEVVVVPSLATAESGESVQFGAEVRDQHGNMIPDAQVGWESRALDVASIDAASGMAQALEDGLALLVAEIDGVTGSGTLEVGDGNGTVPGPVTSLSISPANWILAGAGDTIRLRASATDAEGHTLTGITVEWSSGQPEIATVTAEGLVRAQSVGSAIIIATVACTSPGCSDVTAASNGEVEEVFQLTDPERVTDLRIVESSNGSITLALTEVDDGAGDPANYALRYGSPVVSWSQAANTEVALSGASIGSTLEHVRSGLDPGTSYQFQLVAFRGTLGSDATYGALSNTATGTTGGVQPGEPATVVISPSQPTISGVGGVAQLTATALDSGGNTVPEVSFDWTSSDSGIVSVSQEGIITGNAFGTALVTATVACAATGCLDLPSNEVPVSVQPPPEGLVFHSSWNHELGSHDNALMDGPQSSDWRWNEFFCSGRHDVLQVVPGSGLGWSRTPNILRVEHTGRSVDCGAIQRREVVPAQTSHWGRLYFRSDNRSWDGPQHNFSYNFVGDIQAVFFNPSGNAQGWRVNFLFDYAGDGQHWMSKSHPEWRFGAWHLKSGPGSNTNHIRLPHGEWFRYEWELRYVTPTTIRFYPRIYNMAGELLYDANDFYTNYGEQMSLQQWYDSNGAGTGSNGGVFGYHPTSGAERMRHIGIGNEGRPQSDATASQFWYVADFAISLGGWVGSR
jgi:hypothetical protein